MALLQEAYRTAPIYRFKFLLTIDLSGPAAVGPRMCSYTTNLQRNILTVHRNHNPGAHSATPAPDRDPAHLL